MNPTNSMNSINSLFGFFNVDYLAAFVGPGLGVDAMWHLGFARIFVEVELRRFERIMRAASPRACVRMSSFWIWHKYLSVQILKCRPAGVNIVIGTVTIYQISVLAAFWAKPAAIFTAKELFRNGQQDLLSDDVGHIDLAADHERLVKRLFCDLGLSDRRFLA